MDILDDMGVSKLSAKVFWKVNYSFKSSYSHFIYMYIFQETAEGGLSDVSPTSDDWRASEPPREVDSLRSRNKRRNFLNQTDRRHEKQGQSSSLLPFHSFNPRLSRRHSDSDHPELLGFDCSFKYRSSHHTSTLTLFTLLIRVPYPIGNDSSVTLF